MSSLKQIQEQMLKDILSVKENVDYLKNPERLSVYGEGYFYRIHESLSDDFSITQWALGEQAFESWTREYVYSHPSKNYNLSSIGAGLPDFLALKLEHEPWIFELAQYESNKVKSYHHAHQKSINLEQLKTVPMDQWETAKFQFQPHLLLQTTQWPIHQLLKLYREKQPFSKEGFHLETSHYMLFQFENSNYFKNIDNKEYRFLQLLQEGQPLGDVCTTMEKEDIMNSIFTWFQEWNELGLITDIVFKNESL